MSGHANWPACRAEARTRNGRSYKNSYCFVLKLADGKIIESREWIRSS